LVSHAKEKRSSRVFEIKVLRKIRVFGPKGVEITAELEKKNYITMSFMDSAPHPILLGLSNRE
jgi:hypothetical protein